MATVNLSAQTEWETGFGRIRHTPVTVRRIHELEERLRERGIKGDDAPFYELLEAADRLAGAAMWLVVHDTYARAVHLDGRALTAEEFKPKPEGHTGSALNIVPAYVGYLLANALTGHTRGWIMEQGHAVSGVDSVNLLVGNLTEAHAERYGLTDEGLTRFVQDFYAYRIGEDGRAASLRGSHVNAHTAGGILEGGYLGFAGLQYVHMPLPGERLVAFLSDGAFEEQRGPDWAPRWWRAEDSGLVAPIMINNGRRIDQRTTMSQQGGAVWFKKHLRLNGFDPIDIDGRDPASYAWAILEMETRELAAAEKIAAGEAGYPVRLPYGIATVPKGFGFYGEGTNAAHNLPLGSKIDAQAIRRFNAGTRALFVPYEDLRWTIEKFNRHERRPREKQHPLVDRRVSLDQPVAPRFKPVGEAGSPMRAVDQIFAETCKAHPHIRPRVGNPDEILSNRMDATLQALKHRVTDPEPGINESVDGAVITALNEEAVAAAALANKGGINLIVTYEAFGVKMHGAIRQEIIFADHCRRNGRPQNWLSIPVVLTSHTYENGKNEQSHQDPMLCEALMGEPADVSRVVFPADYNSAAAVMEALYLTHGQIWTLVVPKGDVPVVFDGPTARRLARAGGVRVEAAGFQVEHPDLILTAIGAYQLRQVLIASARLTQRQVPHSVVYLLEPRRFSDPKDEDEAAVTVSADARRALYPDAARARLFVTHTRAGRIQGLLQVLNTGPRTLALGYRNQGGTLSVDGMMFVNRQSWAHIVAAAAGLMGRRPEELLNTEELAALARRKSPQGILF